MYRSSKLYGLNKCSITISASHQSSSFLIQCKRSDDNEIIMVSYSVCDIQQIARCISKTQCFWKIRWRITFVTVADLRVDASPKTMHHALKRFDTINPRIWQNSKVLYTHFPWTHSRPAYSDKSVSPTKWHQYCSDIFSNCWELFKADRSKAH